LGGMISLFHQDFLDEAPVRENWGQT